MKKNNWLLLSLFAIVIFSSCSTSRNGVISHSQSSFSINQGKLEIQNDGIANNEHAKAAAIDTQKIVYTARLGLTVKNLDSVSKQIILHTTNSNGYVQTASNDYLVIKVPTGGLNNILTELENLGKVNYKNVTADDITDSYYDAVTRLENLDKARSRYLELLAKAQTVEEMLKVEKELERVNGEMEMLKGQLARMDNSIQYSTITVYLREKVKPGILGYPFVWLYKGVSWLFVRN